MVFSKNIPKKYRIVGACCGFFLTIVGIGGWFIMPYLVDKMIDLNVILYQNSDQFGRWRMLPQPMEFKVYIFNVTNANDILNGAIPIVKEIGPYVYKQYRIKNVEKMSKDQMEITYTSKQIFKFDRQLSYPRKESDKIVVLNAAMNVILHIKDEEIKRIVKSILEVLNGRVDRTPIVGNLKRLIEMITGNRKAVLQISEDIVNSQLGIINDYIFRIFPNQSSLFIQTTPKQFFFDGIAFCLKGDEITALVCKVVEDIVKRRNIKAIRKLNDGSFKFALFYYKNNTHDGQYKILSGFNDSRSTSTILTWEGKPHLTMWTNDMKSISRCNLFEKTTDGILFAPHVKPEGTVNVYSSDICRAVQLFYRKTITYRKIIGYRFETGDNFLKKIGSKYSTKCFCITRLEEIPKYNDGCLYRGVLDLSLCHGAPIILSMPHMADAAPEYQTVKGLKPNLQRAMTYVDIEPSENGNSTQFMPEELPRALSQSEMEMIEARMAERYNRLAEKCTEFGLDVHGNDSWHQPNPWEFLVNRKYHIIWCNVFKSASTSWMYNFNILAGYSPEFLKKSNAVPLELARKKYPRVTIAELEKAMNDSTTFLIVRHPFERLLSAYKDKLLYAVPHSLHDKLGNKIIKRYRKKKKNVTYPKWPTFSEFISFILNEVKMKHVLDMHWTPITKFCTPCQVKFDIVAKFETLDEDQRYLIKKTNLNGVIKPEWKNSGKGRNTQDLVSKYYSQLTREQLDGIFLLFRYDLELFDYSSDEYFKLDLVTKEPSSEYKDKTN